MTPLKALGLLLSLLLLPIQAAEALSLSSIFTGTPDWNFYQSIPYGPDPAEVADLYLLKGGGLRPAIIFIHGGGWAAGDKYAYNGYYAKKYGNAGMHVISINYRLANQNTPSTQWPAQLQDVQLAVRWIRQNALILGVDPNRICAFGDSAGGHLALFLGALKTSVPGDRSQMFADQSPSVSCVADLFGPSNMTDPTLLPLIDGGVLFGGKTYAQYPQLYTGASPINYITPQMAPTVVVQAIADNIVSNNSSVNLINKLSGNGIINKFVVVLGGHEFINTPSSEKKSADDQVLNFVKFFLHL